MSPESEHSLAVQRLSKIDRARVPTLIALYLPVEICIYYQVVPIATDDDTLILGMVDPEDLAALDYVGRMLSFSNFKIQSFPLTFQQQQDLIAYYFSHPPDPGEIAALKTALQTTRSPKPDPEPEPESEPDLDPQSEPTQTQPPSPSRISVQPQPPVAAQTDESDETVQQLLNSMLRRALDEKADQIFVEPHDNGTCRVRYRQQGILRDLFKELSDGIRAKLLVNLKRMMTLDPQVMGESQSAEVERSYRGESLVLQLRIVPQRSKEGAILNILRGDALLKYQQSQNTTRVAEVLVIAQQVHQMMQQLHLSLSSTVDKLKQYPSPASHDWKELGNTLDAITAQAQMVAASQQDWNRLEANQDPSSEA